MPTYVENCVRLNEDEFLKSAERVNADVVIPELKYGL